MNALQKEIARLKARNALLEQQLAAIVKADSTTKPKKK